ncbi:MAG: protein kinase domain-containing protein [Desulfococcaceae bacterium]
MKTIGRYIVRGQLGRGGMANVFKVEMPVTGKMVAMKQLKPNEFLTALVGMDRLRELFTAEAATMANLRHPNLVDVWDFDEADGRPFYIMEYFCNNLGTMIGETYETERPSRVLPVEKAVRYIRHVLHGLARLHHAGFIHRDIKPFNMLVTDQDTVKICDFGLSKLRGETFRGPENLKVGTPYYAPPEQEEDPDAADETADLYAAGVTLYRMLTGRLPMESPTPPSRLNPDLDERWDQMLATSLAFRPASRYPKAAKMLAALEDCFVRWQAERDRECAVSEAGLLADAPATPLERPPRSQPAKVRPQVARERFGLDELWRPDPYVRNDFAEREGGLIHDRATGLTWERSGSEYPVTWEQAANYIDRLNRNRFGGFKDWRMPTVEELRTLVDPPPRGTALCIPPVFDATQKWLWSCDRRSHIAAWYVSLDLGFVAAHDFTGYYYVRGVRGNGG